MPDSIDQMLKLLCQKNELVVFVKANAGYSVYVDTRERYNVSAVHFNEATPLQALESLYEAETQNAHQKEN